MLTGMPSELAPQMSPRSRRGTSRRRSALRLTGRPRKLLRAAHVVAAGAWLGLVVAMLALGATAQTTPAPELAAASYRLMARLGGSVIPPLAIGTLLTGFALSLLTPWGIARHWWVLVKIALGLAVILTSVTLTDAWIAQAITQPAAAGGTRLVAASVAHLLMLGLATVISVDKPWGRTPRGRERRAA